MLIKKKHNVRVIMRKGQEKLIEKAKRNEFSSVAIKLLSKEEYSLRELNFIYDIIEGCYVKWGATEDNKDDPFTDKTPKHIISIIKSLKYLSDSYDYSLHLRSCRLDYASKAYNTVENTALLLNKIEEKYRKPLPHSYVSFCLRCLGVGVGIGDILTEIHPEDNYFDSDYRPYIFIGDFDQKNLVYRKIDIKQVKKRIEFAKVITDKVLVYEIDKEKYLEFLSGDNPTFEELKKNHWFSRIHCIEASKNELIPLLINQYKQEGLDWIVGQNSADFIYIKHENEKQIKNFEAFVCDNGGAPASIRCTRQEFIFSQTKESITLSIKKYGDTLIQEDRQGKIIISGANIKYRGLLLIYLDNGALFTCIYSSKNDKGKVIPANLKGILKLKKYLPDVYAQMEKFLIAYLNWRAAKHPVYKDTLKILDGWGDISPEACPTIVFNELENYVSLNDYLRHKYKTGCEFNWNKHPIYVLYPMIRALPRIKKEDRNKFIQYIFENDGNEDFIIRMLSDSENRQADFYAKVIANLIVSKLDKNTYFKNDRHGSISNDEDAFNFIFDYMLMLKDLKQKISFSTRSAKKLRDMHNDAIAKLAYKKMSPAEKKIKAPKNSIYNVLDKDLPDEFKRLNTATSLGQEGIKMRNCIAGFVRELKKDSAAFYNVYIDGKPYDLMVVFKDGKYHIVQLYGVCNDAAPPKVYEFVSKALSCAKTEK